MVEEKERAKSTAKKDVDSIEVILYLIVFFSE